jgi:surface antigen
MRAKFGWGLVWGAVLMTSFATPTRRASAGNCALYARAQTGVDLFGAAGGWWDEAAGRYQRGHVPAVGSILVFRRTGYIPSGHVAVVAQVVNSREIVVNHANWYHGMVTRGVTVIDDSPNNDWSAVAVMDLGSGKYGRDNPTYGFVYPGTGQQELVASSSMVGYDPYLGATRASYEPSRRSGLFHFAVAMDYRHGGSRQHRTAGHVTHRRGAPAYRVHFTSLTHARGRAAGGAQSTSHADGFAIRAAHAHDHALTGTGRRAEAKRPPARVAF